MDQKVMHRIKDGILFLGSFALDVLSKEYTWN
jgi:hypothetical protein